MDFLKQFAIGFVFTGALLIAFGVPATAIVAAAFFVGETYGPLAAAATYFVGICAALAAAFAIID